MQSRLFPPLYVRGQPVPLAPLTEGQKQFAEQHHDLIYAFLRKNGHSVDEYYDVAALSFLHAVQRYLTLPWLKRYAFPTIAWRAMGRGMAMEFRGEDRRRKAESQYIELCRVWPPNIREEAESGLILHDLFAGASPEQCGLARLRAQGYGLEEAAHTQGITVKQARKLLDELHQVCSKFI